MSTLAAAAADVLQETEGGQRLVLHTLHEVTCSLIPDGEKVPLRYGGVSLTGEEAALK